MDISKKHSIWEISLLQLHEVQSTKEDISNPDFVRERTKMSVSGGFFCLF